jgi:hypothetical protein
MRYIGRLVAHPAQTAIRPPRRRAMAVNAALAFLILARPLPGMTLAPRPVSPNETPAGVRHADQPRGSGPYLTSHGGWKVGPAEESALVVRRRSTRLRSAPRRFDGRL